MLNSKDNIWKENLSSKSPLKELLHKKSGQEELVSQPFTLLQELELKFRKVDSQLNTPENLNKEKEMLKFIHNQKMSKFSMGRNT